MKIAVRLDDISPDMDWEKFYAFKEMLDAYHICPLIGIVPENRDEHLHKNDAVKHFWATVKELKEQGWVLAMHGYHHVYSTGKGGLFPLNHFSEFAGIPYEKQFEMLKKGKKILNENGVETTFFMAPAHSYDKNTIKALLKLGFTEMTDGFGSKPYKWRGMCFYPISFLLSRSFKKKSGYTTMVVHANEISKKGMEHYRKLFEEHQEQFISYEEYQKQTPVKRGCLGHAWEYILATVKHVLVKMKSHV